MRTLLVLGMLTGILLAILVGALIIIQILEEPIAAGHKEQFINVVIQPDFNQTVELNDPESVFSKMYSLQSDKIDRNMESYPYIQQKEQAEEDYKKRRENWIRYIDGEVIKGYDPRYDKPFDDNDLYFTG